MKPFTVAAALLGLLTPALAAADFKPPQVFKNANLVHVLSLEKNYVKEQLNVVVENVSKEPQSEYYLPFTADQIARVGGFEVKDRKATDSGAFVAEIVESDGNNHYYKITLPSPLKAGGQQTLGISFYYLKAYRPLPASIGQDDQQFLVYDFNAFAPSSYPTLKQKTEVKAASASIPDYTTLEAKGSDPKSPQKQGTKLTYGPFGEKPVGAEAPVSVRFEFTKPVTHVALLERDIEVSHWGGNVAFEERYELYNRGANLSSQFNRAQWAQKQFYSPASAALRDVRMPLHGGSVDAYFTDTIGNVSTSKFRSNKREALLELKPRYPIFGGWKYPFTVGWNADASLLVRKTGGDGYVLRVPFLEGPKQAEGVEYGKVNLRVLLPEGSENVKFSVDLPESAITESSIGVHKTYLDTLGRTAITIKAQNLVDEFRDRHVIITYDASLASALRKPILVFASMMAIYASAWVVGSIRVGFAKN